MKVKRVAAFVLCCMLIFTAVSCDSGKENGQGGERKSVSMLFNGNSFVFTGEVPEQLRNICSMYGIDIEYKDRSTGNAELSMISLPTLTRIFQNEEYDYFVIQDYGTKPGTEEFFNDVKALCDLAKQYAVKPILYNPAWVNIKDENGNPMPDEDTQQFFTEAYEKAAEDNGAVLVNAGDAWVYQYRVNPQSDLYKAVDDYHANDEGAYLTACVFASTLFNLHIKDEDKGNIYKGNNSIALGQSAWEFVTYYNEHKAIPEKAVEVPDGSNKKF